MPTPSPATTQQPAVIGPDISAIVTEDDTPVDNIYSEKQQRLLTEPLLNGWGGPPPEDGDVPRPFVAMANVGVFVSAHTPPMVPDAFVSADVTLHADVHAKAHRSYFVWEFGKVPDVVIEVVSNREGGELTDRKKRYRQMLVPNYVVWDPEHHLGAKALHAFELRGQLYVPMRRVFFAGLGLGLKEWAGRYEDLTDRWLRWCDTGDVLIATAAERADAERARADAERARADAEQERAEELRAQLRALGVDPKR